MNIKPLTEDHTSMSILFDSYIIDNIKSFDELLKTYHTYKQNNTDKTILITLNDLGQAEYTSSHSIMSNDLDDTEGYDLSSLDTKCFENGEHLGYLSTPSEFFIRRANFLKQTKDITFATVCDGELTIDEDEIAILEEINNAPLAYLDEHIILKIIPTDKSYEAICGFPNGYFSSDLNPFENYAIAKHLSDKYNYELFGIGASFLGFIRSEPLEVEQARELIEDLSILYDTTEKEFEKFYDLITNRNTLFLKYIEYLEY